MTIILMSLLCYISRHIHTHTPNREVLTISSEYATHTHTITSYGSVRKSCNSAKRPIIHTVKL